MPSRPRQAGKDLIIVESPAKTRTLSAFLGPGFEVRASMGHVRDLPKSKLGVDLDHDFAPAYQLIPDRRSVVGELKKAAKASRRVYLASDPDREGEAIAWHLAQVLEAPEIRRIEFNEITRSAVEAALARPRDLNMHRVNAQQARRVLDRLVGYKISPLLWEKVQKNLSAGRVQSVALRLVVEREREILGFVTEEYWSLTARLTPVEAETPFLARLAQVAGKKAELTTREQVEGLLSRLGYGLEAAEPGKWTATRVPEGPAPEWRVGAVQRREQRENPRPPFITSTLQQEAARKLGFNARRTMQVAQALYEGLELGAEGHVGLITYMRTDSVAVSAEAQAAARELIRSRYGAEYLPEAPRRYRARAGAQEAHEAIRPTYVHRTPEELRPYLSDDQFRLYQLIWLRFVASQMASAVYDVTTADVTVLDLLFRATGRVLRFPGFTAVYTEGSDDSRTGEDHAAEDGGEEPGGPERSGDQVQRQLPPLEPGDLLRLLALLPRQHYTEPPPRYSEATLVRALEERGIGRPSTYAQILSTILDRNYVELRERRFVPTELGMLVNDQLVRHFPDVVSADFTARVEQELDDISAGERDWISVLREFYTPFSERLARAATEMQRLRPEATPTDTPCPQCGKAMVVRTSRYGRFLGCSGFPECRHTVQLEDDGKATAPGAVDPEQELMALGGPELAARAVARYESVALPTLTAHARHGVLGARAVLRHRAPEAGLVGEESAVVEPAPPEAPPSCPECGRPMQQRRGRFGAFWGCTGYPECKTIVDPRRKPQPPPDPEFRMPCPRPGCTGEVTAKRSWRGTVFYGCSNYNATPPCEYVAWGRPLAEQRCEQCGYPRAENVYRGQSKGLKCTNAECPTNAGQRKKPARGGSPRKGAKGRSRAPAA